MPETFSNFNATNIPTLPEYCKFFMKKPYYAASFRNHPLYPVISKHFDSRRHTINEYGIFNFNYLSLYCIKTKQNIAIFCDFLKIYVEKHIKKVANTCHNL